MDIATDMEVFGPVVPIITFDTDEEAVAIANASKYGLSASVITSDMKKSFYYTEAIEASAVWVNGSSALRHNDQPFGGTKSTGIGNEGGGYSCEEFSRLKTYGFCGYPRRSACLTTATEWETSSETSARWFWKNCNTSSRPAPLLKAGGTF